MQQKSLCNSPSAPPSPSSPLPSNPCTQKLRVASSSRYSRIWLMVTGAMPLDGELPGDRTPLLRQPYRPQSSVDWRSNRPGPREPEPGLDNSYPWQSHRHYSPDDRALQFAEPRFPFRQSQPDPHNAGDQWQLGDRCQLKQEPWGMSVENLNNLSPFYQPRCMAEGRGDLGTWGLGDWGTWRMVFLVSPSPRLPITPSSRLPVTPIRRPPLHRAAPQAS